MSARGETIAAVSTPGGRGPRGILRLSGPAAFRIAMSLFRAAGCAPPPARGFSACSGALASSGLPARLLLMKAPRSYTREDVAEIHSVSGAAVLEGLLESALAAGARHASPGEFTKKAFLNGRISLAQAEAVMKIISARSSAEARLAASQLTGGLGRRIAVLSSALADALALVEVGIDFSDQEAGRADPAEIDAALGRAFEELRSLDAPSDGAAPGSGDPTVLLAGPANAGKSSIFNACVRGGAAIVHESPGTTVDANKGQVRAGAVRFTLIDGPGFRPGPGGAEEPAQASYSRLAETADVVVAVVDGSAPLPPAPRPGLEGAAGRLFAARPPHVAAINKSDLPAAFSDSAARSAFPSAEIVRLSALTGDGVAALSAAVSRTVSAGRASRAGSAGLLNARQRASVRAAAACVGRARRALRRGLGEEIASIEIRGALASLGLIPGGLADEAALDRIFERFCIGK